MDCLGVRPRSWPLRYDLQPKILRTCKLIHEEAVLILYAKNRFAAWDVSFFIHYAEVRARNLKFIRILSLTVLQDGTELDCWLSVLDKVAHRLTSLRILSLRWSLYRRDSKATRGLGDDIDFVRLLGMIQGLQKLTISGYYAVHWPTYLQKAMSCEVEALIVYGLREELALRGEEDGKGIIRENRLTRAVNKHTKEAFARYQKGTEDLIP